MMAQFTFPEDVPMSGVLSPEAKAYVTQHLRDMQNPEIVKRDNGVPPFMRGICRRQKCSIGSIGNSARFA